MNKITIFLVKLSAIAIAVAGIVLGFNSINNAPPPGLTGTPALILHEAMLRIGVMEIAGSVITGLFMYVVAGTARAVLDLWNDRYNSAEQG